MLKGYTAVSKGSLTSTQVLQDPQSGPGACALWLLNAQWILAELVQCPSPCLYRTFPKESDSLSFFKFFYLQISI